MMFGCRHFEHHSGRQQRDEPMHGTIDLDCDQGWQRQRYFQWWTGAKADIEVREPGKGKVVAAIGIAGPDLHCER
ncbi:hypothetical protein XH88_17800 [Bradyrhizobium sp. CCBAU 51627]|nr:hypothetical protein [Bradyrhizobium sp. CCBAU 51627]